MNLCQKLIWSICSGTLVLGFSQLAFAERVLVEPDVTERKPPPALFNISCKQDSECVPLPEVYSACFHYCKGDECVTAQLCEVVSLKTDANALPDCFRNVPCVKPARVFCEQNVCRGVGVIPVNE